MTDQHDASGELIADLASRVSDAALVRVHANAEALGWPVKELEDELVRRGLREWVLR